jgi:hypothetical protein
MNGLVGPGLFVNDLVGCPGIFVVSSLGLFVNGCPGLFVNGIVGCPGLFVNGLVGCPGLFVNGPAVTPADISGITGQISPAVRIKTVAIQTSVVNFASNLPVVMEDLELVHPIEGERGM